MVSVMFQFQKMKIESESLVVIVLNDEIVNGLNQFRLNGWQLKLLLFIVCMIVVIVKNIRMRIWKFMSQYCSFWVVCMLWQEIYVVVSMKSRYMLMLIQVLFVSVVILVLFVICESSRNRKLMVILVRFDSMRIVVMMRFQLVIQFIQGLNVWVVQVNDVLELGIWLLSLWQLKVISSIGMKLMRMIVGICVLILDVVGFMVVVKVQVGVMYEMLMMMVLISLIVLVLRFFVEMLVVMLDLGFVVLLVLFISGFLFCCGCVG